MSPSQRLYYRYHASSSTILGRIVEYSRYNLASEEHLPNVNVVKGGLGENNVGYSYDFHGTQLSDSEYAARRKALLALSQLRAVGEQGDLDLLRIAVIGNQSAGKSLVVEAISGVGSRGILEHRMCWIAIYREVDQAGKPLAEVSEKPFREPITDKNAVELALQRLIQNVAPEVVKLVEDKVTKTISGNCLILVAIPTTGKRPALAIFSLLSPHLVDEIENQRAIMLACQQDPEGVRTTGAPSTAYLSISWTVMLGGLQTRYALRIHEIPCTLARRH
ncbi:hypothetical protein C8J57DRAFT_1624572 [Mycena rebaudengoi]|nr:hypothetical protein C8J57DRAFT_1624572 [Mycena rebaudengoi]